MSIIIKHVYTLQVKYLALKCYTSRSCEEMTRNICRYIFSKDLKRKFNWQGTSVKIGLKTTRTGSLISGMYVCVCVNCVLNNKYCKIYGYLN